MVEGARSAGIPTFESHNGRMMECGGGASILDVRIHNGKRLSAFRSYTLKGAELERFIRDAADTYHHQTCTAKMGRDSLSVVDAHLKVYGIDNLRIADGSIMPRVMTGNTMAACITIGERAGQITRAEHKI
jgi:choline dehydrogenase-like flavoprotein